jgi:predicted RNase H-like HicB family nuclease
VARTKPLRCPKPRGQGQSAEEARDQALDAAAQILADGAEVTERDGWFFVLLRDLDLSNQGQTLEEAKENLKETLFFYLSDD